jgi:cytidylate kinase
MSQESHVPDSATSKMRIAIDGPAASGKSAVGSAMASRLGLPFIDTGGIYRALTWLALSRGIALDNSTGLTDLASTADLKIESDATGGTTVSIDGLDATAFLRTDEVEQAVSAVSAVPGVRAYLVAIQRQLAGTRSVMAGRDIGSVVLPDAELKLFLDASPEERARRRAAELAGKGPDYATLVQQMRRRDYLDSHRLVAPLQRASDAVRLVTDRMSLADVLDQALSLVRQRWPASDPGGSSPQRAPAAGSDG